LFHWMVLVGGDQATYWGDQPASCRREAVVAHLALVGGRGRPILPVGGVVSTGLALDCGARCLGRRRGTCWSMLRRIGPGSPLLEVVPLPSPLPVRDGFCLERRGFWRWRGVSGRAPLAGAMLPFGFPRLRAPEQGLHFAGTELAERWPGYIDVSGQGRSHNGFHYVGRGGWESGGRSPSTPEVKNTGGEEGEEGMSTCDGIFYALFYRAW
jgi:hypothetical protein